MCPRRLAGSCPRYARSSATAGGHVRIPGVTGRPARASRTCSAGCRWARPFWRNAIGTEVQAHDTSLVIVGAGGHARVVADAALQAGIWTRVFVTEAAASGTGEFLPGVARLAWDELARTTCAVHIAIG